MHGNNSVRYLRQIYSGGFSFGDRVRRFNRRPYAPAPRSGPYPTPPPTESPTQDPTEEPTYDPTDAPTQDPTDSPTYVPTDLPTAEPSSAPTEYIPIKSSDPSKVRIPRIHGLSFTPRLVKDGDDIRTAHLFRHDRHIDVDPNRVWLQRYVNSVLGDRK